MHEANPGSNSGTSYVLSLLSTARSHSRIVWVVTQTPPHNKILRIIQVRDVMPVHNMFQRDSETLVGYKYSTTELDVAYAIKCLFVLTIYSSNIKTPTPLGPQDSKLSPSYSVECRICYLHTKTHFAELYFRYLMASSEHIIQ